MFNKKQQQQPQQQQQPASQPELQNSKEPSSGESGEKDNNNNADNTTNTNTNNNHVSINIDNNTVAAAAITTPPTTTTTTTTTSNNNNSSATRPLVADNANQSQGESTSVFKQLFATLEAEHQKLQGLELRRIKLTEEMKNLREMLQQENRRLHSQSQEPPTSVDATPSSSTAIKKTTTGKKSPRQVAAETSEGFAVSTLENYDVEKPLVPVPLRLEGLPRPQTAELIIELVDSNSAIRQLQTIESSALWHTPVTSVDLETYLEMSNISIAQSSTESGGDQDSTATD